MIRDKTYCKYKIANRATLTTDRFKHNNFQVNINMDSLTSLYLIWIPKGTPWGDGVRVKQLKTAKSVNTFQRIGDGNEWWVLLEPKKYQESSIEISTRVTLEDMPADEK